MLRIVTCFKWVIDDADIRVDAESRKLNLARAGYKISTYDRNAIEEGVRIQEQHGGSVAAVTVAPPAARPCLKDALSRGPDAAWFVNDPSFADLDASQTSEILARTIRPQIEFDLILCGEGSGDLYSQQVGPALAEKLGIPCVTWVNKIAFDEKNRQIVADRKLEEGVETVSCPLPALVVVLPDINSPRIPTLKQVLGAAKKPVHNVTLETLGEIPEVSVRTERILAAVMDRRRIRVTGDAEGIRSVVNSLIRDGVIP
jgi:electron transfer flavoprotein beta subunit